jgi:UDP-GlcNAc:undecaprenyl-phosphate GlcNAc-1-phosphate transferase
VRIQVLGGYALGDAGSMVLTLVWLIGCTNAFNLIDGLDGLASGMGLFSTLTIFVAALLAHDHSLALATLPLCGSLLGFLRYNFNPASVFLGDSGSLLIGFLLGCYGAIWSQKSATLLGMTAPLMALALPLLDVVLSVVRRWLRGQPIFGADRHHIHHKLLEKGLTHRGVVIVLYAACGVYAALSLLESAAEREFGGLILVLFCAVTWVGVQNLGYLEFGVAGKLLAGGALRRVFHGQIALDSLDRMLDEARNVEECWRGLQTTSREFGFTEARARLNGRVFEDEEGARPSHQRWQLRIPLPAGDYVNLCLPLDSGSTPFAVGPLVELLYRKLPQRLAALSSRSRDSPDTRSLLGLAAATSKSVPVTTGVRSTPL